MPLESSTMTGSDPFTAGNKAGKNVPNESDKVRQMGALALLVDAP